MEYSVYADAVDENGVAEKDTCWKGYCLALN